MSVSSSIARSKCSSGIVPSSAGRDVRDARAPRLLRVPDLPDGRKLPVGDHDLRALREAQAARERAHARGERGRHGDLVRRRVDEPGEGAARRLLPLDPVLPGSAVLVPVGEVLLVGRAHRVRQRSLRAGVDVDLLLEDREPVAAALRERRCLNGQGRPFAVFVREQLLRRALQDAAAGREDVAAVGDRERHVRILLDDQHRDAGLVHLLDDLEAALDEDRRQAHRRLVHQQQLRVRHQRAPHRDHLLLAARRASRRAGRAARAAAGRACRRARSPPCALAVAVRYAPISRFSSTVIGANSRRFSGHDRHPRVDPVARRAAGHVLARELDRPVARLDEAEDRLQRRRLARRVAAEQGDELAFAHVQVEVLEDVDLAVVRVDRPEQRTCVQVRPHFVPPCAGRGTPRPRVGFVATSSNEPSAILTPWSSATTRSEMPSTTCMSCSITRIV